MSEKIEKGRADCGSPFFSSGVQIFLRLSSGPENHVGKKRLKKDKNEQRNASAAFTIM
jgi:hypothetical protein